MISEVRFLLLHLHIFELCASFKSFCGTLLLFFVSSRRRLRCNEKIVHKLCKGVGRDSEYCKTAWAWPPTVLHSTPLGSTPVLCDISYFIFMRCTQRRAALSQLELQVGQVIKASLALPLRLPLAGTCSSPH